MNLYCKGRSDALSITSTKFTKTVFIMFLNVLVFDK